MKNITLDESLFLGKGNERLCYIHPEDNTRIIKVPYKEKNSRNQNELEYIYYKYLEKKGVSFEHIAKCYDRVSVGDKKGLVFDRVLDFDGSSSCTLSSLLQTRDIPLKYAKKLLDGLGEYLKENTILFVDVSLDNVMCQKQIDRSYKLIIVDGLGARRTGWKFWLYRHVPVYAKYKVRSQWKKVIQNFIKSTSV